MRELLLKLKKPIAFKKQLKIYFSQTKKSYSEIRPALITVTKSISQKSQRNIFLLFINIPFKRY